MLATGYRGRLTELPGVIRIITALEAHAFGLAWYEQYREGTDIRFRQHIIMNKEPQENRYGVKFSELHAIDLVDIESTKPLHAELLLTNIERTDAHAEDNVRPGQRDLENVLALSEDEAVDRADREAVGARMTWSIVARDASGALGVAVASRFFAVGALCPHIRSAVGALSTQALMNPLYGRDAMALMGERLAPEEILQAITAADRDDAGDQRREIDQPQSGGVQYDGQREPSPRTDRSHAAPRAIAFETAGLLSLEIIPRSICA